VHFSFLSADSKPLGETSLVRSNKGEPQLGQIDSVEPPNANQRRPGLERNSLQIAFDPCSRVRLRAPQRTAPATHPATGQATRAGL